MRALPQIDAHAHIRPDLSRDEVATLDGVVLAASRSLDESRVALAREDERVVWGVGCHPGLVGVQKSFDPDTFRDLIQKTPLVSEVGLDGKSRVAREMQVQTFRAVLGILQESPRIVSVHTAGATDEALDLIEASGVRGVILHWWLGDSAATRRAIRLGCYFSVNASPRSLALVDNVPPSRLFCETDHPFGDRREPGARPGNVEGVERRIARGMRSDVAGWRRQAWENLLQLARDTDSVGLFQRSIRRELLAH